MEGKIIIITGSNSGIGKETAIQLLEDGAKVIFACPDKKETKAIIKKLPEKIRDRAYCLKLDLCSFSSIEKFVKKFSKKFEKLDILINNSAICPTNFKLTEDGIESVLQTNFIGPVYLSISLLKYFDKDEGRIINTSSLSHMFSDITDKKINEAFLDLDFKNLKKCYFNGLMNRYVHYCNTKKAVLYFSSYLANLLDQANLRNLKVCSILPGIVNTNISKPMMEMFYYKFALIKILYPFLYIFVKTPKAGAQTGLHVCYMKFEELVNGGIYQDCKLHVNSNKEKEIRDLYFNYTLFLINVIAGRQIDLTPALNVVK
jgi:retinol dehydrogenase 12